MDIFIYVCILYVLPLRQAIGEYNIPIWNQVHCYAATDMGRDRFGKKTKKAKIATKMATPSPLHNGETQQWDKKPYSKIICV